MLKRDYFDVIIIGGGITGAGIALDAVSRGLRVALFEKNDFASGTSSKSTKLIHGGLRYLKQYEFGLVREMGRERAVLHKLATHLVRPEKMLLPLIKDGNYGKIITSVGLMVYDVLADVSSQDQRKMLSVSETKDKEPLLDESKLEGGGIYAEYQADDFRLVIELIKKARSLGAVPMNYTPFVKFLEKGGKICGVEALDAESNESFKIYADFVINAAGPWADIIRGTQEQLGSKRLRTTKGIHLVVPYDKLPVRQSLYFDVPDGRMIFAIPRDGITYIGTTDTEYNENLERIHTKIEDVSYLLTAINDTFHTINIQLNDILSSWAGVRPLIDEEGKSSSEVSRKDEIFVSSKGLITIAGGKLTGYRKMAKRVVDKLIEIRSDSHTIRKEYKSKTKKIKLPGNSFKNYEAVAAYKSELIQRFPTQNPQELSRLVDMFGDQSESILSSPKSSLLLSALDFCIENEMVVHLTDFFIYRTGMLYFDIVRVDSEMESASQFMAKKMNWSEKTRLKELNDLQYHILHARTFQ